MSEFQNHWEASIARWDILRESHLLTGVPTLTHTGMEMYDRTCIWEGESTFRESNVNLIKS